MRFFQKNLDLLTLKKYLYRITIRFNKNSKKKIFFEPFSKKISKNFQKFLKLKKLYKIEKNIKKLI